MTIRKIWSKKDNEEFTKMYFDGVSYKEMSRYFERNVLSIQSHVYDLNLKGKKRKIVWEEWEIDKLLQMRKDGKSWKEISDKLDRPAGGCQKKHRELMRAKEKEDIKKGKNVGDRIILSDDRVFEVKKIYHRDNKVKYLCERVNVGYKEMFLECQLM